MTPPGPDYDIIFAGGGAAACLAAGRLAAADSSLKILIVEAGPPTKNDPDHVQPGRFITHMAPDSKTMKFMVARPSEHLDGRVLIAPAGQCLGGGSSVNLTMYARASASEYDDWEEKYKNVGWGSHDLIPLLRKTETFEINPAAETHGSSGPLKVSWGGLFSDVPQSYLDVAAKYDKGRDSASDANDLHSVNVYARWPKWIDSKNGHRSDTPHFFIYPQEHNTNLRIVTGHLVKRVLIKDGRAVGVEYVPNPRLHPEGASTESTMAYAKKLVVVTAGAFGSPLILERSGIGAVDILKAHDIVPVVDLPGVGENYQGDHQAFAAIAYASDETLTIDGLLRGEPEEVKKWTAQWEKDGSGLMSINGIDAGVKLRPTESELASIGPAFQAKWRSYYAGSPDKPVLWFGCTAFCFAKLHLAPLDRKYFGCASYITHPSSRGRVHITSGTDPLALADFAHGYLEHEEDMELHVWAYKRSREFGRRMACYRGEWPGGHPDFAKDSPAAVSSDPTPVPIDSPAIQYTEEDNRAIRTFVRESVVTTWHALGTCAMKPREEGGVVDARLNVYGVDGLKVADLSVAPSNVGSNTMSTALVIAEKAALIIAEELGISGV